ncbi:hypothetical protein [Paraburkholderia sp.]|uniref:hypothetical protein n=1 Tax=Paraburkholderia sp. TaxID=1926495 RepID=UPI0025FDEC76|nr:hypothetical protein [Paraburkholderia sp.]
MAIPLQTDPPEPDGTAAIEFRNELLGKGWPDDRRISELVGLPPGPESTAYTVKARAKGALLGVWSAPLRGFVYPDFQLDRSGSLRSDVAELLAVLPDDNDRGGWRRAFWLYSPHALLDGRTPADVFADAPTRVIEVAQDEFWGSPDTAW